ncbi:Rhodanese-like domain-containing protein 14 [Chlorella vulgaris]
MQALSRPPAGPAFTGGSAAGAAQRRRGAAVVRLFPKSKTDDSAGIGFKFDGAMQRWVRDDRFIGKSLTTVTPLSGTPYVVWPLMHTYLTQKGLKQVDEEEALALQRKGHVIVDVRLASDFKIEHIEGAINVPMFRETAGTSGWDKVKRVVMAGLVMKATERDPDFMDNFQKAVGNKRKPVIIACAVGGTLDTIVRVASTGKSCKDPDRSFGRETRSLKACYELLNAGYSNVVHLKGGLSQWRYDGYPTAGTGVRN